MPWLHSYTESVALSSAVVMPVLLWIVRSVRFIGNALLVGSLEYAVQMPKITGLLSIKSVCNVSFYMSQ